MFDSWNTDRPMAMAVIQRDKVTLTFHDGQCRPRPIF